MMTTKSILLSLILAFPLSLLAEPASAPLRTGDSIPNVSLQAPGGDVVSLRKIVSEKPTVLIFYRGGWCPYCTKHLSSLMEIEPELLGAGYQIVAISPDQPSKLAETPNREKLSYTLLSDSSMEAAKSFGIAFEVPKELVAKYKNEYSIDIEAASGQTHHLLPHPSVFIVGTDGVIRFAHMNDDYKVRLEPEKILKAVKAQ